MVCHFETGTERITLVIDLCTVKGQTTNDTDVPCIVFIKNGNLCLGQVCFFTEIGILSNRCEQNCLYK